MCAITGIFSLTHTPFEGLLSAMIQTLAHRGPDAQGIWIGKGVGLAHARLSIIDLDPSSNQPMHDPDSGNTIIFNGEIYNYIELREELISFGYTFRTKSDTEVILKSYSHWGVNCLNRFNGMWAIVIFDRKQNSLFASRDRVGVKPFVYGVTTHNDLVFASEAKAIAQHFPEFNQVNQQFLLDFIERDFFACYKETFYKNMFNLLPGHYFFVKPGEIPKQIRYWKWTPKLNTFPMSDADVQDKFNYLLTDSIKLRFRSDVPVGSCLSGGLDSGTIVGVASKLFEKRIHTFSCIYPSHPAFDESHYINASVREFNTISQFVEPKHDDFISLMKDSVYEQDGPTGGPSILSQRAVMELASKDVKVLLDGQGADELLGGYHSYFRYSLLSQARSIRDRKSVISLFNFLSNSSKIKKRFPTSVPKLYQAMILTRSPVSFYTRNRENTQLGFFKEFENDDLNTLLLEHVFTNLTNLLHYEDRNSMRFSIESRLPFLDYRLIEFAFSLPSKYKIRGSTTKWLLHGLASTVLPKEVLNRKDKMGFTTPAHEWFLQNENMAYFKDYLSEQNPLYQALSPWMRDYLNNSFKILSEHKYTSPSGPGDINALWRFFTANMWHESRSAKPSSIKEVRNIKISIATT